MRLPLWLERLKPHAAETATRSATLIPEIWAHEIRMWMEAAMRAAGYNVDRAMVQREEARLFDYLETASPVFIAEMMSNYRKREAFVKKFCAPTLYRITGC